MKLWQFQSTFPRGERPDWKQCFGGRREFQSTFPRGERPSTCRDVGIRLRISIHVPTRGTTHLQTEIPHWPKFQSTFPRGERQDQDQILQKRAKFQSTFPRGERPGWLWYSHMFLNFNPRSHEGNDYFNPRFLLIYVISIHVPTRGTTIWVD